MEKNVADLILEQLAAYNVKFIFGVTGDAIFPLIDALTRQERIRFIPTTIEISAAFMASAYAKLTGSLGVCVGTSGPGAANLVSGVAEAYLDKAPVLCLTGQVERGNIGTNTKQYIDQNQLFTAVTDKSRLCVSPEATIPCLSGLIHQALSNSTAVHLAIPMDVLSQATASPISPIAPYLPSLEQTNFISVNIDQAITALQNSTRPLLIIGNGARNIAARMVALAEQHDIGIIISHECKGAVDEAHSLALGGIGPAYLPESLSQADLILEFGEAAFEEKYLPQQVPVIYFTNTMTAASQKGTVILGSFEQMVALLQQKLNVQVKPRKSWRAQMEKDHQNRREAVENNQSPEHPLYFFSKLSKHADPAATITLDVGEFLHWFNYGFAANNQRVILSSKWRGMGCGIPAGIAAALSQPDKKVITVVGDGGLLMSLAELSTVAHNQLPISIFVLKNNLYGLEKQKMVKENLTPNGLDLAIPDLANLAEAFRMKFYRLTGPENYTEKLSMALSNPPCLVEVEVTSEILPNL